MRRMTSSAKRIAHGLSVRLLIASILTASSAGVYAQQMETADGSRLAMAAAVQSTGDAKANQLAANLLKNGVFQSMTIGSGELATAFRGLAVRPASNGKTPDYATGKEHTHLRVFLPAQGLGTLKPPSRDGIKANLGKPPESGMPWNTPSSLGCVYNLLPAGSNASGCAPDSSLVNPTGGAGAIAIVDAYDTPATATDLKNFSLQFGLTPAQFQIVYASGTRPQSSYYAEDQGWDLESELDVQWAHAMAPNAKIFPGRSQFRFERRSAGCCRRRNRHRSAEWRRRGFDELGRQRICRTAGG